MTILGVLKKLLGIGPDEPTKLRVITGSKVKLKEFNSKETIYNPREFRTDKGNRK